MKKFLSVLNRIALELSVPVAVAGLWVLAELRTGRTQDLVKSFCGVFVAAAIPWASLLRIMHQQSQRQQADDHTRRLSELAAALERRDHAVETFPKEAAGTIAKAKSEPAPEPKKEGRAESHRAKLTEQLGVSLTTISRWVKDPSKLKSIKKETNVAEETRDRKPGRVEDLFGGNVIDFQKRLAERKRRDERLCLEPPSIPTPPTPTPPHPMAA